MIQIAKTCRNQIKINLKTKINRNWIFSSKAEAQEQKQPQAKPKVKGKIVVHILNVLQNRKMVVNVEFEVDEGTLFANVTDSIHSLPAGDAITTTPVTVSVTATASTSATIPIRDSKSPPTKKQASDCDSAPVCKFVFRNSFRVLFYKSNIFIDLHVPESTISSSASETIAIAIDLDVNIENIDSREFFSM